MAGVNVKTVQARLGHSDPKLTLAVYAQATSEADRAAADVLGKRLMSTEDASSDPPRTAPYPVRASGSSAASTTSAMPNTRMLR